MSAPVDTLYRLKDVMELTKLGSSTIYRMMDEGKFPRPLRLGPGSVRWRASAIRAWMDSLSAAA